MKIYEIVDTPHYQKYQKDTQERTKDFKFSENLDDVAEIIAKTTHNKIDKKLGTGTRGVAYLTDRGLVLKLTKNKNEATKYNSIKHKTFKHFVTIYDVAEHNGIYGVLQEYADTNAVSQEDLRVVDYYDNTWELMGEEPVHLKLTPEQKKILQFHEDAFQEAREKTKIRPDLHADNIGKRNGNYVAFDMFSH